MYFAGRQRSLSGCGCRGGVGASDGPAVPNIPITGGSIFGDNPPEVVLRAQVNRYFDPSAGALQLQGSPVAPTGPIDSTVSPLVALILGFRMAVLQQPNPAPLPSPGGITGFLTDPFNSSVATAPTAPGNALGALQALVNGAMNDPTGAFVTNNIATITPIISGFADLNGLATAVMPGQLIPGIDNTTLMLGAAALVAVYVFTRKKRR